MLLTRTTAAVKARIVVNRLFIDNLLVVCMDQIKSGTGMQTLSSELASSSQLRHNTFGVLVSSLSVLVNPLLFNMHM